MEGIVTKFNKRYINKNIYDTTYSYFYLNSEKHFTFFNLWIPENLKKLEGWKRNCKDYIINGNNNLFNYLETSENINSFLNTNIEKIYSKIPSNYTRYKYLDNCVFEIFGKYHCITNDTFLGNGAIYFNDSNSIKFKTVLCVKQEYIRYFKLWLLTNQTIEDLLEFDIFYILIDKSFEIELTTKKQLKTVFNKTFGNLVKHYGIPVTFVDNLTKELLKTVNVPKFNTIKEYNNWLDEIKINTFKKEIINDKQPISI